MPLAHALPSATQTRLLPSQHPEVHAFPGQHAWPGPPHTAHVLLVHTVFAPVQLEFEQQGCPAPPQAAQVPPPQATLAAVHEVLAQQAWPGPPQLPQLPPAQVPPSVGQVAPPATQVELTQQPPPHALPAQHVSPGLPHTAQTLFRHTVAAPHRFPAQHVSPAPPQPRQTPALQVSPEVSHALFAQHGWPGPPQAAVLTPQLQLTPSSARDRVASSQSRRVMNEAWREPQAGRHRLLLECLDGRETRWSVSIPSL